jgi:phosphoribosylglycinamide formyltransferase 1
MSKPFRIAIFASGNGTNAESIMNYFQSHSQIEVGLILSNNKEAKVLERADRFNVSSLTFDKTEFRDPATILTSLEQQSITHIVLAGFMWLVPRYLVNAYPDKIVNIHPALLPKFGGKGMYGVHVHQAVKNASELVTGITIHLVNEHYDEGAILFQKTCSVASSDSAEDIADKVHRLEHYWYPITIENWITK